MKRFLALITAFVLLAPFNALAAIYNLDPVHSTIEFKVKHLMITNVKGVFQKFKGTVFIDEKDISKSKADVSIEMASVNARGGMHDMKFVTLDEVIKFADER